MLYLHNKLWWSINHKKTLKNVECMIVWSWSYRYYFGVNVIQLRLRKWQAIWKYKMCKMNFSWWRHTHVLPFIYDFYSKLRQHRIPDICHSKHTSVIYILLRQCHSGLFIKHILQYITKKYYKSLNQILWIKDK